MRCGKSSCNLLIILKKSYLLKNFVHYIKKMLNFHSLYSDCVWYKKLRELAFVHYIANFTISRFVITKFGCTWILNEVYSLMRWIIVQILLKFFSCKMKQGKNQNIHFTWILALIFHLTCSCKLNPCETRTSCTYL